MTAAVTNRIAAAPGGFTHGETLIILFGLMLGMFLGALDQTIVATALPSMAADLNGAAHLSWVVSAYLLTTTAVTPIYGKLSDLYGRKILLQIAILIFLAASVLCALAGSMTALIVYRALQGVGGGGLISMAHATIADVISPRDRGRYQGYIAGVWGAASIAGPVLGGLFVDYLDWRWVFWINLPIGLAALAVSQAALKRLQAKRQPHRIDYAGSVLIVSATTCLLLVTTMGGNELPWRSSPVLELIVAAIVLFAACVLQELRAPEPMIPPRLFRNKIFVYSNLCSLLGGIAIIGSLVFLPLFLQMVYALPASIAGLMLIPFMLANAAGAVIAGRLIAKTGRYRLYPLIGLGISSVGSILLATVSASTPGVIFITEAACAGFGTGFIGPAVLVAIQNAVDPRDLGAATAAVNFFRALGGAFGAALFGAILLGRLGARLASLSSYGTLTDNAAADLVRLGPSALAAIPTASHEPILLAITASFHVLFWTAGGVFFAALLAGWFIEDIPLKTTSGLARRASLPALSE